MLVHVLRTQAYTKRSFNPDGLIIINNNNINTTACPFGSANLIEFHSTRI